MHTEAIRRLALIAGMALHLSCLGQEPMHSGYVDRDGSRREAIVFVHGVTGDAKETWTNAETRAYWPRLIRSDNRFAAANVWVFSYASPKNGNAQTVEELALKLGDALSEVIGTHDRIYFIAHSMGGLIVREMLVLKALPSAKVPLIYFYGTPSAGADLAGLVAAISQNPQFENLRPFARQSDVASFARSWLSTSQDPRRRYPQRIWSYCAYEIQGMVANKLIVPMLSASYLCSTAPRGALANHSTMVKPKDRASEPYEYFASAYDFSHTPAASILASNDAITVRDEKSPGIDTAALKVKFASIGGNTFAVNCGDTRSGSVPVALDEQKGARILAATAVSKEVKGMRASFFEPTVDSTGSLVVKYKIAGAKADLFGKCPTNGSARIGLQYVVEER